MLRSGEGIGLPGTLPQNRAILWSSGTWSLRPGSIQSWTGNVLEDRPDLTVDVLERTRAVMDQHFPDAAVTGYSVRAPGLDLPDADDIHVLAAAIEGGADLIVTCTLTTSVIAFIPAYTVKVHADHNFLAQRTRPACPERSLTQRRQSVSGGPRVPGKASSQNSGHETSMAGHHRRSRE